jgi:hypothetical protein
MSRHDVDSDGFAEFDWDVGVGKYAIDSLTRGSAANLKGLVRDMSNADDRPSRPRAESRVRDPGR